MNTRAHIIVQGLVQGVYFRHYTSVTAQSLGLTGWVRNLHDGRVEVLCEGPEEKVLAMIEWCKHGPQTARVEGVVSDLQMYTGEFGSFDVRY